MAKLKCPYCQNDIWEYVIDHNCPHCGELVRSDKWINELASGVIYFAKRDNAFEALKIHIYNSENEDAIRIIRELRKNKEDAIVEQRVIERILEGKPANWTYVAAPKVSIPTPASNAPALVSCKACGNQISNHAETCPHCGHPTGVHVCPKCGGIRTRVISGASKTASIFFWGAYAANKVRSTYECLDCKQKF